MDIHVEKLFLIEQIAKVQDVEIINQIKRILGKMNDPIVGYSTNDTPITRKQLIKRIDAAEKRIARGEFTTQEDLEKEAANW
ncbi:MAG: hypothetical protein OEW67_09760 [Cyclobacteriaceae bacterium]|nr:hypothetical protein [Cyclobacteriaceae bacterium]